MAYYDIAIETHFCAAHALRDYKGKTEPIHGHNFKVIVTVTGERVDQAGMAVDFLDLKPLIDEEVERFNYGFVNQDVAEFGEGELSPSAENMACVLYRRIAKRLPQTVEMGSVQVFESPGCSATYRER